MLESHTYAVSAMADPGTTMVGFNLFHPFNNMSELYFHELREREGETCMYTNYWDLREENVNIVTT